MTRPVRVRVFEFEHHIARGSHLESLLGNCGPDDVRLDVSSRILGLLAASFVSGVGRSFAGPAMYSIAPQVRPKNLLASAATWFAMMIQIPRMAGPMLGEFILAYGGNTLTLFAILASLTIAFVLVWALKSKLRSARELNPSAFDRPSHSVNRRSGGVSTRGVLTAAGGGVWVDSRSAEGGF